MYGTLYPQDCSTVPSKVQALKETFYCAKMKFYGGRISGHISVVWPQILFGVQVRRK